MATAECYPAKAPRVDDLLETLNNPVRREVVHFFENYTDAQTADLDEITTHIERRVSAEIGEDLRVKLTHTHLPKLDDYGWLNYHATTGTVQYHGHSHADEWLTELRNIFTQ
ncbi:MAG: DUF7344 domain-containing protein [Halolamina sp.]